MNIKIKCNDEFIAHILDENYKEIREEKSNSFNPDLFMTSSNKSSEILVIAFSLSASF